MRRKIYSMEQEEALGVLLRAESLTVAGTLEDGSPALRVVHGIVTEGWVAFHGASAGEKLELLGRPVVISAHEIIAQIPSTFFDPERACPATTYYLSAQVEGVREEVVDVGEKAALLQALMERYQPEGGYVPITADDPLYAKMVRGIMLARVSLDGLCGKKKVGQNRTPAQLAGLMGSLWRRGKPGDVAAIEALRQANPSAEVPAFLVGPEGVSLIAELDGARIEEAAELVASGYWNAWTTPEAVLKALSCSQVRVGAVDAEGRLIAAARATTDGARRAWIYDVMVTPDWRGRGVGEALMRLVLDHPLVREVETVMLATKDAMSFYERLGFVDARTIQARPWISTQMILVRGGIWRPEASEGGGQSASVAALT